MALAAADLLRARVRSGLVIAATHAEVPGSFESITGSHPTPTGASEHAGRRALLYAQSLKATETLVVLLSGGASALMAVPADGLTLEDKRLTTERLLRAGAPIHALNTVRKHLSAIKGGWLAARSPAACRAFAISDVVGDDPSVIASGPTVVDASTFEDAIGVLQQFGGVETYPENVICFLRAGARGEVPETPKAGDPRLARAATVVIGSRRESMDGAAREAAGRGYAVAKLDDPIVGEARIAARACVGAATALAVGMARPSCIIASGETTVHVRGTGAGGRNQEFVLGAAALLESLDRAAIASVGTDGIDGPTDAAGAVADTTTIDRARKAGLQPAQRYLDDNNSYAFFDALGDLIRTGPTATNVGDLQVLLLA
jgi:glycerate 2-kinase